MARGDQLGRQWKLILKLISSSIGKSVGELAKELEFRSWIMSWGALAEVLEPEWLREEIRKQAEAVLSIYGAGTEKDASLRSGAD